MARKEIPVLLLTGYLGSGKTTLLNRILTNERGLKFAVIVNDLGEVNIDASLIQKGGVVGQDGADDLIALQNGCICCTLKMDLIKQLMDIVNQDRFDYIVIEASGICEPAPIANTIVSIRRMASPGQDIPVLDCIVTVVDALRMKSEFGCGDSLERHDLGEEDIERLIIEQIEFCNLILLNKASEVSATDREHLCRIIRALQPKARIIETDYAAVDLAEIIGTGIFDFEDVATSATWVREIEDIHDDDDDDDHHHHDHHHHEDHDHHHHHHHHDGEGEAEEYGISTFVYQRRPAFNFERFDDFLARHWPASVIRCKGVLYFSQNPDMSILFEQAGVQKKITEAGLWYATAPEEELRLMLANDPGMMRDWDPDYGDRMIKLVFIGRDMDRPAIEAALDSCLDI